MSAALEREPVRVEDAEELNSLHRIEDQIASIERGTPALLGPDGEVVTLPKTVFELLRQLVGDLARGRAVSIVPVHAELTTQQAADLLNVSRPFLIKQLEAGKNSVSEGRDTPAHPDGGVDGVPAAAEPRAERSAG